MMMQIYNKYLKRKSFERNIFDNFTQTITLATLNGTTISLATLVAI